MIPNLLLLMGGVGALYFGAEWLVRGAARMARELGVRPIVVGLTVVSLGTSAPELVVSVVASLRGNTDIAVGNVLGSNLANIGLILGLTAIARPMTVAARVIRREVPAMLLVTVLLFPLVWDHSLSRWDGGLLLVVLVSYLIFVFRAAEGGEPEPAVQYQEVIEEPPMLMRGTILRDIGLIVAGGLGLFMGGRVIVDSGTFFAAHFGMSELVIGLTVVAVGTSLPELATSLVAAIRKEADIAVGNIIGSNVFNIAAVLGVASLIKPMPFPRPVLQAELPAVMGMSVLLFVLMFTPWKKTYRISRFEGTVLLVTYLALGFILIWGR